MRKIILQEFLTLDGLAADTDGSTDFTQTSLKGDQSFVDQQLKLMSGVDTMLLGRVTYEMFSGYWPKATEGEDKEIAAEINPMHKIVFSSTIRNAPWGDWEEALVVKNNAVNEVPKLKMQPGKNIVIWGSISLAQSLINKGLIDEYRMVTCPAVLGSGRSLFLDKVGSLYLNLHEAKTFDHGAVQLTYIPAKTAARQGA